MRHTKVLTNHLLYSSVSLLARTRICYGPSISIIASHRIHNAVPFVIHLPPQRVDLAKAEHRSACLNQRELVPRLDKLVTHVAVCCTHYCTLCPIIGTKAVQAFNCLVESKGSRVLQLVKHSAMFQKFLRNICSSLAFSLGYSRLISYVDSSIACKILHSRRSPSVGDAVGPLAHAAH